jgi:P27 family predicted phage terminase small subunit
MHLRLLKGNPSRRPVRPEVEPQSPEQLPAPPEFLSEDAKAEWHRLIGEMVRLRLVTGVDTMLFAVYCQSSADWKTSVEVFNRTRALLIKDRDNEPRTNPLVRIVRNAGEHMLRCAGEFGLTPTARARIAASGFDVPPPPSKFGDLLG